MAISGIWSDLDPMFQRNLTASFFLIRMAIQRVVDAGLAFLSLIVPAAVPHLLLVLL
jgi:hypothetical protein